MNGRMGTTPSMNDVEYENQIDVNNHEDLYRQDQNLVRELAHEQDVQSQEFEDDQDQVDQHQDDEEPIDRHDYENSNKLEKMAENAIEKQREDERAEREMLQMAGEELDKKSDSGQELHEIIVRGEKRQITLDEMRAMAQKNDAADSYLAETRNMYEEAKAARNEIIQAQKNMLEHPYQEQQQEQRPNPEEIRDLALKKYHQYVAEGDDKNAIKMDKMIRDYDNMVAVRTATQNAEDDRREEEFNTSLARDMVFGGQALIEHYPEMMQNQSAMDATQTNIGRFAKESIRQYINQQDLQTQAAFRQHGYDEYFFSDNTTPQQAVETYRSMLKSGYPLMAPSKLIYAAGKYTADALGYKPRAQSNIQPSQHPQTQSQMNVSPERQMRRARAENMPQRQNISRPLPTRMRAGDERSINKQGMAEIREMRKGVQVPMANRT